MRKVGIFISALSSLVGAKSVSELYVPMDLPCHQPFYFAGPGIPKGPADPIAGTKFLEATQNMNRDERDKAIVHQIVHGNVPKFLRVFQPVTFRHTRANGELLVATILVTPDYLSVGTNDDYVRTPMSYYAATEVARAFGYLLPTSKVVDVIHQHAAVKLMPIPTPPGPAMVSSKRYLFHNREISRQVGPEDLGKLIAGHKKDIVISKRQLERRGLRVPIYGWHQLDGVPIQPLSLVHGADYADYSHGVRLISPVVVVNGRAMSMRKLLESETFASLLSNEGPIHQIDKLMSPRRPPS